MNELGKTVVEELSVSQNRQLLAPIIISLITSVVLVLEGIVVSIYALSSAFTHFAIDRDHATIYASNFGKNMTKEHNSKRIALYNSPLGKWVESNLNEN